MNEYVEPSGHTKDTFENFKDPQNNHWMAVKLS